MKLLLNIIWFVFGGIAICIEYLLSSILLMLTIVGIPFGLQTLKMGMLALWPFGKEVKTIEESSGCLNLFMNVIWFFIGGVWIMLTHLVFALVFCITIVGIPFGLQHFKLAGLALRPFGKEIINTSPLS